MTNHINQVVESNLRGDALERALENHDHKTDLHKVRAALHGLKSFMKPKYQQSAQRALVDIEDLFGELQFDLMSPAYIQGFKDGLRFLPELRDWAEK